MLPCGAWWDRTIPMVIHISEARTIEFDAVGNREKRRKQVAQRYLQTHGIELDTSNETQLRAAWQEYELERRDANNENRAHENERRERAYAKMLELEQQRTTNTSSNASASTPATSQAKKARSTRYGTPSAVGSSSAGPSHGQL